MELFSPIYKYFTLVPNQKKEENTVTYYCNICKDNGRVSKNGEPITCKTYKNSTSNLFTHLRSDIPYHEEALKLIENLNSTPSSKGSLLIWTIRKTMPKSWSQFCPICRVLLITYS